MREHIDKVFVYYAKKCGKFHGFIESFWAAYGDNITNEFDELCDVERDTAASVELHNLKTIIMQDANIDKESPDVARVIHHINSFIMELNQEVDYEYKGWEIDEGMEEGA